MARQIDQRRSRYRKNWKKWVAIYLAVGVVAYLVIYLVVSSGGGRGLGY